MSDKKQNDSLFSNTDTIVRRAWIDTAINSVRAHLEDAEDSPAMLSEAFTSPAVENGADISEAAPQRDAEGRPKLYVAWSAGVRRSGT